jgi:hypothetical protein
MYRRSAANTSPKQNYLMIVAGAPQKRRAKHGAAEQPVPFEEGIPPVEIDWNGLGDRLKGKDVRCSTIAVDCDEDEEAFVPSRRMKLKGLVERVSMDYFPQILLIHM